MDAGKQGVKMDFKKNPEDGTNGRNECEAIEIIDYDAQNYRAYHLKTADPNDLAGLSVIPEGGVRWINVDAQCEDGLLRALGDAFQIHPLIIENIRNRNQRPKIEEYKDFLYIVAKMIYYAGDSLVSEHMNFILGYRYVITLGETKGDVFGRIRSFLENESAHVRTCGPDYLMYLLLDAIVDGYFDVLETLSDQIDELEERIMESNSQEHLLQIREFKKTLLKLNRNIWPLRDVASLMGKESTELVRATTEPYLRDVYNHIVQAIDTTETCRELLSGLTDLHLSNTSNRLNEIMKVLTIISTIFIPLSFLAGVYGMNFKYMPELGLRWGYGAVWALMLAVAGAMVCYFKKKKWF